jgi:hypothetical protein
MPGADSTARALRANVDESKRSHSAFVSGSTGPTNQKEQQPVDETFSKISWPDSKGVPACIKITRNL